MARIEFELSHWRTEMACDFARNANDPEIARFLRDAFPYPYTEKDARDFICECIAREGKSQLCRAITTGGQAIGSIGIFFGTDVYAGSGETGYWLAKPFWGKGIMAEALQKICAEAFADFGLDRIFAEPFASNAASRAVLEKAGFRLEGILKHSVRKNGVLQDSCIYALLREEAAAQGVIRFK